MLMRLREWLIGPPLPSQRLVDEHLSKLQALAAFSPDALASIAYANQEIYLGLALAGAAGLQYSGKIALAITGVLLIVAFSYYQTIYAYPKGGGSYTVARENLGLWPGLIAAAALMLDYVLNAAVSVTAGVAALVSAFPMLWLYRVSLALFLLALITIANLRGVRESGTVMAVPVYLFIGTYALMIGAGVLRGLGTPPATFPAPLPVLQPLSLAVLLHAFASGCTALTGVEAISNGVPAFKPPSSRNAGLTLAAMAGLMAFLFLGTVGLTQYFAVTTGAKETILSALSRRIWGYGLLYYLTQGITLLMLAVAANTSFAGFPRLASILAQDGYMPRQFSILGDRLVFSNGILALAGLAALLVIFFNGDAHALVPLFAVCAFLAFTLSQSGMVVHWWRTHTGRHGLKLAINALGAGVTLVTLLIIAVNQFLHGAWIVFVLLPLLVLTFQTIHQHYQEVARQLTLKGLPPALKPLPSPRIVVPVGGVHRGVIEAMRYARSISNKVTAVYVEVMPGTAERVHQAWERWECDVPLVVVPSPYRSTVGPFLEFLERTDREHNDGQLATVLLPEFVPARWWQFPLHNQTAWQLKLALLYGRRKYGKTRVIIDVPFFLRH